MAADKARAEKVHHEVIYETSTCRTHVDVRACASAHGCACAHVCVRVCVIKEKALCKDFC